VTCSRCGAENRPGRKFCGECASPLAAVCPACGAANEPSDKFCGECAAPLAAGGAAAPAIPTQGRTPATERRVVTVLFADLVGFTPFAEGRDAEDVRETLSRYFDLASAVVARYGGTVEKFIGDAVMAVWGAPLAKEDDAERAVRAGIDLVDQVRSLGSGIAARAGVLTGEAAVTVGAVNQGLVAGDLVNTAARLQSVAPVGAVLVGEATQRAASRAIVFEPAGEQLLKGKASPVPAWRAVRVVAQVGGRNRAEVLEAPFVGRDDELRLLKDQFHATGRDRRPRLVSVIGPGGIGKTRLAWELHKYLDGLVDTVWSHDGRSPAYGDGITFWALGEMVRQRCRLRETDDEATTRVRVAEALAEHVPDAEDRRWIEPALLALLGIESVAAPEQLFAAWRTFFERMADTAPVVLLFEDFHYADPGLLDFVDHLLDWSRSARILVVTLARPELLEKRPTWGAGKRNFTSLYLEPLPEPAMRELLAGLVPGLPEAAVRAIVSRADGIPLYAVETVRMLVAEGRLELADGVYRPVGDLSTLAIPETLSALIASRLDGLPTAERALISDAAVLGQSFSAAGLAAVSGRPEASLAPLLADLARREILAQDDDPRSPERGQYRFVQALIREVAYNTLARADRRDRHLAAARYFEALGSDELAGALAGHYLAAYRSAADGPEAEALAVQARLALRGAAERAATLGAHEQAMAFFDQAATVATDGAERTAMVTRAGEEASAAGMRDAADHRLREALALARATDDRLAVAAAALALGRELTTYDAPAAIALLEPAAAEFADLASDAVVVELLSQVARAHFINQDIDGALARVEPVLVAAEHAGNLPVIADALVTKGSAMLWVGRQVEGLALLEAAVRLAESLGLDRIVIRALINRASVDDLNDPASGIASARTATQLARRSGLRGQATLAMTNGTEFALRTGDWAWAVEELDAALADNAEGIDRGFALQTACWFRALRGEPTADMLAEIARFAAGSDDPNVLTMQALAQAFVAFVGGDYKDAAATWRHAGDLSLNNLVLSRARAARASLWAGDVEAARADVAAMLAAGARGRAIDHDLVAIRAGIAAAEGRADEALGAYRVVLRVWREMALPWDEALAAIDMATLLDPGLPEVAAAVDRAREILAGLGARPILDRLDEVLARTPAVR
jgi:class 3 adenylate cyclase